MAFILLLSIIREVLAELKAAGATWTQFDEPTLVKDLDFHQLQAFTHAYSELESATPGLNILIETYFADLTAEAFETLMSLKGVTGFGFDLVRGSKTFELIKDNFPLGKYLFAGVVDGRNIWANNLSESLSTLKMLENIVGKGIIYFYNFSFYKKMIYRSVALLHIRILRELDRSEKIIR